MNRSSNEILIWADRTREKMRNVREKWVKDIYYSNMHNSYSKTYFYTYYNITGPKTSWKLKTLVQQRSIWKAGFLNLSISRNRTYTRAHILTYNHIHSHSLTRICNQTHTNIHAHIYSFSYLYSVRLVLKLAFTFLQSYIHLDSAVELKIIRQLILSLGLKLNA